MSNVINPELLVPAASVYFGRSIDISRSVTKPLASEVDPAVDPEVLSARPCLLHEDVGCDVAAKALLAELGN
jgi:hypothetical protein